MSDSQNPEQQLQSILSNVSVGGNLSTGDITQIFKIFVNLDQIPKPQGIPQNIVSSSTDKFVGRERDLENLNQQLQRNNQVVIAAVEGMGGVGKTELAIQYSLLNLQLETYPGGICWLRAREQDIGLQIVNFARTDLDLNPPDDLELPDRVRWCWKRWREGNTLIVLDDVKDYSDIKPYLPPQSSQFKVLITTRLKLDLPSSLYLAVLSQPDALGLLGQLVGSEKVEQELEIAKELCQRLGYLPLALQLVGRYVKDRNISLAEELNRLEKKGLGHPSMEVPENDPSWTLDIKRGVKAAFQLSWDEIKKFKFAQELGCLLSLFALAPIPWSLVESAAVGHDSEELEDARVKLEKLHLLQSGKSYQLHQLIQEFFRDKQNDLATTDEQKSNFCTAIVEVANKIPQTPNLSEINSVSHFIPHLAEVINVYQKWLKDEDLITPFIGLNNFYRGQGIYAQVLPWAEQCLLDVRKRLGEEHTDFAHSLNILALAYESLGRYEEAESIFLQALKLRRKILGEEHYQVATSLNNLALLYESQGRYEEAEHLYLEALEIDRKTFGEEYSQRAIGLNNLAALYNSQGRYKEAEPLYLEALKINQNLLGEEHPYIATNLNNLAALYRSQERYEEAEPLFLQALAIRKKVLGKEHPHVATVLSNLAGLYRSQERYEEAEPLFLQALAIRKKVLGEENPHVTTIINNLARLYHSQGKYKQAESLFLKTLELDKKLLGEEHPYVATSLNNLAALYRSQERYDEAEILCLQALTIVEKILGKNHPTTNKIRENYEKLKNN